MDDDKRYKRFVAMAYYRSQTEEGKAEIGDLIRRYELYIKGMKDGIDLVEFERSKTKEMTDEVSKDYKDLFNLSYTLTREGGDHLYDGLMKLYENSPVFKTTDSYKALKAGKEQAELDLEREMSEMYRDDLKGKQVKNEEEITKEEEKAEQADNGQKLSPEQIKELEEHEKEMVESEERKTFNEATGRIKKAAEESANFVDNPALEEERLAFLEDQERKRNEQKKNKHL